MDIARQDTQFLLSQIKSRKDCSREITVFNSLSDPLVLYKIEIGSDSFDPRGEPYFAYSKIEEPIFIQPLQESKLFELSFIGCEQGNEFKCPENQNVETTLTLHTNASTFTYPLVYFSGMIKFQGVSPVDGEPLKNWTHLDMGLTSVDLQKLEFNDYLELLFSTSNKHFVQKS